MHQDLFSVRYADGAPEWATIIDDKEHVTGQLWSDAYIFSDDVNTAYLKFWINRQAADGVGLQDHYARMWAHIVTKLKDHPALIGFDVLNEPFPGENSQEIFGSLFGAYAAITQQDISPEEIMMAFADPSKKKELLSLIDNKELYHAMAQTAVPLIKGFDQGHLTDFYSKMTAAIRKVTPNGVMMLENTYFSNMGIECSINPALNNGQRDPLQVYAPHGYDLVVDTPDVTNASNNRVAVIYDSHKRVQDRLDMPVLVGEWGAHSHYQGGLNHIQFLINYFDSHKWSNTYWCYHECIETAPVMSVLRRPYPQAVAGEILSYNYDFETAVFEMTWNEDSTIDAPTEIYLPTIPYSIDLDGDYSMDLITDISHARILRIPGLESGTRKLTVCF
jgi:endoglycosylceramidase